MTRQSSLNIGFIPGGTATVTFPTVDSTLIGRVATGRLTAQTAAAASVATYTVGASDASYFVMANVNVTAATTASITVTVTYTDETNTSRTTTFSFVQNGVPVPIQTITNTTGTGAYSGSMLSIRCKAATAITIATVGTFTSVTYNVEGQILQA